MGSLCRAQLTPAQLQRVREVQKELQKKFTPARSPSVPSHVRTQNTYVVDSLYNDLYDSGTSSWQEDLLHTYDYYPNSTLLRTDSLFRKAGGSWIDSVETRYYYTSADQDSIQVTYVSPDGTTWKPSDSTVYSYTTSGNVTLETILYYTYNTDNSAWELSQRQYIWYSNNRPDSALAEGYDDNTNSWNEFLRVQYKYAGSLLDSIISYFNYVFVSGGYFQKYFYDAASRPSYIRDTLYASFLGGSPVPGSASDRFITYTTSTSQQIAVDSLVTREYDGSNPSAPPTQTVEVARYSYDANDNLKMIVYEDCAPICEPYERDRYVYKLLTTALVPGKSGTYSLCGRACESLTLPQGWEGLSYELYNLGGQKLSQGTLGGTLTLPAQPGLYILLARGQAYRLQVLP